MSHGLPRVISPLNADALGVTRKRARTELRRGNWQTLVRGVTLARPDDPTREDWAGVGIAIAGPGAAVSGWDALRPRGVGAERPPVEHVLVLSPSGTSRRVGGVLIRPTSRAFVSRVHPYDSLPLVHPARATADTALDYRRDIGSVRALVSRVLQRRLCTLDELVEEYRHGPRRYSASLRLALEDAADGARSAAEAQAAERLAQGPIPAFELNVPVIDRHGTILFVIDAFWRHLRAGLEIDSRKHHFEDLDDWEKGMGRHNRLARSRLSLVHYSPWGITRVGSTFVPEMAAFLAERAAELGVVPSTERGVIRPTSPDGTPPPFVIES